MVINIKIIMDSFKKLIIKGYKNLNDIKLISENRIIIDNCDITGIKLKLKRIDDYNLEIIGLIENVKFN